MPCLEKKKRLSILAFSEVETLSIAHKGTFAMRDEPYGEVPQ